MDRRREKEEMLNREAARRVAERCSGDLENNRPWSEEDRAESLDVRQAKAAARSRASLLSGNMQASNWGTWNWGAKPGIFTQPWAGFGAKPQVPRWPGDSYAAQLSSYMAAGWEPVPFWDRPENAALRRYIVEATAAQVKKKSAPKKKPEGFLRDPNVDYSERLLGRPVGFKIVEGKGWRPLYTASQLKRAAKWRNRFLAFKGSSGKG